jgi:hypothetical protein
MFVNSLPAKLRNSIYINKKNDLLFNIQEN